MCAYPPSKYSRRQFGLTAILSVAQPVRALDGLPLKLARVGHGIELHYVESGRGTPSYSFMAR